VARPADRELPEFLRVAGHPLRWRLLGELARSDRMVHELTRLVGQPQSLVSYHLGRLRSADLVSARRSSADGRDTYYTVDLTRIGSLLGTTGSTLHPGLRLTPAAPVDRLAADAAPRVLFLCTGNSARSQIAEALTRVRSDGRVEACSAGSHPKTLHPNAVRVMREEHGIDIAGQRTKHLDEYTSAKFDRVITLCDRVREVCPELPGEPEAIHWSIPDPAAGQTDDDTSYPEFERVAADLETRVGFLLAALTSTPEPLASTP
jgi:protein-tyrosine-phosphatase